MDIPKNAPQAEFQIQGLVVKAPAPFSKGHTCTENEAEVLNQTLRENLRNNLRTSAEELKDDPQGAQKLQKALDEYLSNYEFGVRGAGGFRTADPVEAEALDMARKAVKASLKKSGRLKGVKAAQITEAARKVLAGPRGAEIRKRASAEVEARKAAEKAMGDIEIEAA